MNSSFDFTLSVRSELINHYESLASNEWVDQENVMRNAIKNSVSQLQAILEKSIWFKIVVVVVVHTVDTKTVTPAQRQTVTAVSTTNTRCTIFKQDSFNIKVHIVYKILALVLAIISLLDQQKNTFTFTASRSGGDSFHVHCVYPQS